MNVLHVWSFYDTSLRYHVNHLAAETRARGHGVTILSSDRMRATYRPYSRDQSYSSPESLDGDVRLVRIRSFNRLEKPVPLEPRRLVREVRNAAPDVLHLHSMTSLFNYFTLFVSRTVLRQRGRVVINDHTSDATESRSLVGRSFYAVMRFLFSLARRHVDLVIVPNEACRAVMARRFAVPPDRLRIIPLGYDATVFHPGAATRHAGEALRIGFAGKVNAAKRIDRLFDAMTRIGPRVPIQCVVAGVVPGSEIERSLNVEIERRGLHVELRPLLDPDALARFYASLDVAVFPGSISITTIEASGCGTPVIIHESVRGLEDRVDGGKGVLFDTDEELDAALLEAAARKRAGAVDHEAIAESARTHSWQAITTRYIEAYEGGNDEPSPP